MQEQDAASQPALPKPGRYRHFKGAEYEVLGLARHSETEEILVVYFAVKDPDQLWVRPATMFAEQVDRGDGLRPRFEPVEEVGETEPTA